MGSTKSWNAWVASRTIPIHISWTPCQPRRGGTLGWPGGLQPLIKTPQSSRTSLRDQWLRLFYSYEWPVRDGPIQTLHGHDTLYIGKHGLENVYIYTVHYKNILKQVCMGINTQLRKSSDANERRYWKYLPYFDNSTRYYIPSKIYLTIESRCH